MGSQVVDPSAVAQAEEEADEEPESAPSSQPTDDDAHAAHGDDGRPGPLAPGETGFYGAPFTITDAPLALASALETCAGTGEACLVEGTVDRVCQMSGCWFTVNAPDVDAVVRIRMLDYGFFVPRNAMGANVTFQGTLELVDVPQAQAQHYADDEAAAGGEAREVEGPERTYAFTITGAEITTPAS